MLKIGEFSKISRVSVRMLRHYDEIGLLKPAQTDDFSGYRYYSESQLPLIGQIHALKEMGFSLSDIIRITQDPADCDKIEAFYDKRQLELQKEAALIAHRLTLLDTARKRLRKDKTMTYNVSVKTIPERYAATVSMVIPRYEDEAMLWNLLMEEAAPLHLVPDDPCLTAAEFPDDEYKEENLEVVIWKTVKGTYPDTEHVKFKTLPSVKVASCVVQGDYSLMPEAFGAVISWVKENGYEPCGAMLALYHVSPHETEDASEYITEVCLPLK